MTAVAKDSRATRARPAPVHTSEQFTFLVNAPIEVAWPLFGADRERVWAPDWNPVFVWPADAEDQEGMVFTVPHSANTAVWINTVFDREANRIQYVYILPNIVATVITLQLAPSAQSTRVAVTYSRTELAPAANEAVTEMASRDRVAGLEWQRQINAYLGR